MSSLRIKVQIGDDRKPGEKKNVPLRKFIYIIDSPSTKTIDELIRSLQEYIIKNYSFTKTQIIELMTNDGFALPKSELCSKVLKDNDHIICVDMEKFIDEYNLTHYDNITWLEVKQADASDDRVKSILIGPNKFSELYIRMFATANITGIYIFSIYDLIKIANEKQKDNLIARLDGTNDYNQLTSSDWFLETKWEYDTSSNKDLFLICNLKIGSNDQIFSNKLHLLLDHSRMVFEKGEIQNLSGSGDGITLSDQQRERLKELAAKLPSPKQSGPQIELSTNNNLKIAKYECEGESSVRMAYGNTNTITAYQDFESNEDNTFSQQFIITHIVFSKKPTILPEILNQKRTAPVDKPVSVANLTVFYQTHDGAWRECQGVALAPVATRNEEPRWLTDSVINIEPDKLISFSIKGWILVKGYPGFSGTVSQRVHKSLPQPFKLKIVVVDNLGKQSSLIVEQLNKPLELETRESFLKSSQSAITEILAFIYADNIENDERSCMAMYISIQNKLVIKKFDSSCAIFDRQAFRKMEFKAKQNKTSEVPLNNAYYQRYTYETNAIALFDPETYMFYAIRLELSTKTSKAEETILIPLDKIK